MAARCGCAEAGNAEAEREPSMKDTNPNNPASNADREEKIEWLTRELSEGRPLQKAPHDYLMWPMPRLCAWKVMGSG